MIRVRLATVSSLMAVLITAWVPPASAAPGDLDPTFSTDGKVTTDFTGSDDFSFAVVLQTDGKLVAAGAAGWPAPPDFALARYNPDGSLDTGFGTGGTVVTDFAGGEDWARALVLQPDGKLVAAGYAEAGSDSDFALARYNPDGSLDTSFGDGGKVTTAFYGEDVGMALVLQPDGKLVAAGKTRTDIAGYYDFALARYNPNGTLDTGFGDGGKVTTDFASRDDSAAALVQQPDGRLVVAGVAWSGRQFDFAVARYNTGGSLDATFGSGGKVFTDFARGEDSIRDLALQPDNKLVAVGYTGHDIGLVRYNLDGSLDLGFGTGGKVVTDFGGADSGNALVVQPDGKLVVGAQVGEAWIGTGFDFGLARYNSDGSLDTGFGTGGKVTTDFGGASDSANALLRQPDGKLVAAGSAVTTSGYDFALARYLTDSTTSGSTLTVTVTGSGRVVSNPAGISCPPDCTETYASGITVRLRARPASGFTFAGWGGDCTGTGPCTVVMTQNRNVTATFTPA